MRVAAMLFALILLTGCSGKDRELDRAMALRARMLAGEISFDADITADYGDELYAFSVFCEGDRDGNLGFRIMEPKSIAEITGVVSRDGGKLTFSDTAVAFPLLADGQLSPASAPWIFYTTLRGGYLTAAGMDEDYLRVTINDSYESDALQVDIWLDGEDVPVRAEILYDGRRILTLSIRNFQIM